MSDVMLGMDEVKKEEPKEKPKKVPYALWTVNGEDYKLVLTTGDIVKLEQKFGKNLLALLDDENGLPPLSTMLTITQAALTKYQHGYKFEKVLDLYDEYTAEGHTQSEFLSDVIIRIFEVSGFFTEAMMEELNRALTDAK